jgi:DHA2 family multidrug resistance protein-like MFS transporter
MDELSKQQKLMLVVMVFGTFVTFLNQTTIAPALPTIMVEQGIDAATGQWLTTAFTLVNAIMIPITAYLIEHVSTRRLFIVSMMSFLIGSLLCTWGPNFPVLLAGRVFQAMGAGVLMPMTMTILIILTPINRRGRALGVYGLVIGFAPMIGPTLAGIIIDAFNWHIMFAIVCALVVLVLVFAVFTLENLPQEEPTSSLDVASVCFSTLGFGGLLYGFSAIGSDARITPLSAAMLCVGAVFTFVFFRRQTKLEKPMLRVDVFKSREFTIATIVGMIVQAALLSTIILLPIYVQTYRGMSATVSGLVMLPGALAIGILSPVTGGFFDKHGPRGLGVVGCILLTIGMFGLGTVGLETSMFAVAGWNLVRSIGIGFVNMPITTWGVNSLNTRLIPHGNSLNNTLRQVSAAFGTAIIISTVTIVSGSGPDAGTLERGVFAVDTGFWVSTAIVAVALVLTVIFVKPSEAKQPSAVSMQQAEPLERGKADSTVTLRQIMRPSHELTVRDTATVREALDVIYRTKSSGVPIVNEAGVPVGFLSDGDVLRYLAIKTSTVTDGFSFYMLTCNDRDAVDKKIAFILACNVMTIATKGVICIDANDDLGHACKVLGERHLKKAPVTEDGVVVGVVDRWTIDRLVLESCLEDDAGSGEPMSLAEA